MVEHGVKRWAAPTLVWGNHRPKRPPFSNGQVTRSVLVVDKLGSSGGLDLGIEFEPSVTSAAGLWSRCRCPPGLSSQRPDKFRVVYGNTR
jgi:hypothetical protein